MHESKLLEKTIWNKAFEHVKSFNVTADLEQSVEQSAKNFQVS